MNSVVPRQAEETRRKDLSFHQDSWWCNQLLILMDVSSLSAPLISVYKIGVSFPYQNDEYLNFCRILEIVVKINTSNRFQFSRFAKAPEAWEVLLR